MDVFRPNDTFLLACGHAASEHSDLIRFILIGLVGSIVALLSVACNSLLLYVFSTSRRLRRQNYANPVFLALFDLLVSACFVLLIAVQVTSYYNKWEFGVQAWVNYVEVVYLVRHICESMCNFLLLMASLERLLGYKPEGKQQQLLVFMVRRKKVMFGIMFALSILLKGSLPFETGIQELPHCSHLDRYVPVQSSSLDSLAPIRFWARKTIGVIVPFIVLLYCNCRIVLRLRTKHKRNKEMSIRQRSVRSYSLSEASLRRHYRERTGVRVATQTLVLVVGCYLLSNILSLFVNIIEFCSINTIQENYYFFLILSDCAWLMTIAGCACRLPIYCCSDARIRKAIGRAIFRFRIKALPTKELRQQQLEKWSMVVVSNSLRSNLTNANNMQEMGNAHRSKRARDELAFLLHARGKMIVDMTFRLGVIDREQETHDDWLTDIQEEESHFSRRGSRFRSICASSHLLSAEEVDEIST